MEFNGRGLYLLSSCILLGSSCLDMSFIHACCTSLFLYPKKNPHSHHFFLSQIGNYVLLLGITSHHCGKRRTAARQQRYIKSFCIDLGTLLQLMP